ncbi:MAG: gluconate transporter [Pseudonocardia sp.]|nr:gluconate transporter [Pseudonocardia sp.]
MTTATAALVLAQSAGTASGPRLIAAALIGIVLIVVLITRFKVHPFLGLTIGSLVVGAIAGLPIAKTIDSFGKGFGDTAASIGTLIALGAMFGKLLADSGGADEIVDTIVGHSSTRTLPWAMALVGALIGLPMFFEIGLVLLMPVIFLVARRSGLSLIRVGAEPGEVPDRRHDRQPHGRVDPGHRHQPQHFRPRERDLPEIGVDQPELLAVEVQLTQQRRRGDSSSGGSCCAASQARPL